MIKFQGEWWDGLKGSEIYLKLESWNMFQLHVYE